VQHKVLPVVQPPPPPLTTAAAVVVAAVVAKEISLATVLIDNH
jgi:hypothetical protein